MENFSLDNVYVVGNDLLDAQHRVILSYMTKVYAYLLAEKKDKDLFELVERLEISCRLHFLDEEKLLEEMDYQEIEAHKAQHALFITHLGGFIGRYEELSSVKNIDELIFLKGWFLEHIEVFDKQYAEYKKCFDKVVHDSIQRAALKNNITKK
jgi:hemerythrin-like metal-binding protein